ncbi:TetR/AcrR family transcriptional regulator [Actinomadura luteofluorescens]|uniref:TetR/AcrR family transcriptional regulator n=1 Tax=Actinomadura luteofluorescens TaxID=46163 RepID=UPI00347AB3B6
MGTGDATQDPTDTHVRAVVTRLFSELGYDAVSNQMIASAVGVTVDVVTERYGGKRALYVRAFEDANQRWRDHVREAAGNITRDADGLRQFVNLYVDHCLQHPEMARLWIHRWLSDASDIAGLEERTSALNMRQALEVIRPAVRPDVDPEALMLTLIWMVNGYLQSGFPDASGRATAPDTSDALDRFRRHLDQLIRLMTASAR